MSSTTILLMLIAYLANIDAALTQKMIEDLRLDIIWRINTFSRPDDGRRDDNPLLGTLIRLVFHDCAAKKTTTTTRTPWGKCDGCINVADMDHDGLEFGAIYPLQQVFENSEEVRRYDPDLPYTRSQDFTDVDGSFDGNPSGRTWSDEMSLADFWSLAGTIGLEYGVYRSWADRSRNKEPTLEEYNIPIKYYYGRNSCGSNAPFTRRTADLFGEDYTALIDWRDLRRFMRQSLGLNKIQTIAIMGVHTLGRTHRIMDLDNGRNNINYNRNCCGGSGFIGSWKRNTDTFDNELFRLLERNAFIQMPANEIDDDNDRTDDFQWIEIDDDDGDIRNHLMLNVDMALLYDIDDNNDFDNTGYTECIHENDDFTQNRGTCDRNVAGEEYFELFRENNQIFLAEFMQAWYKMIQVGNSNLNELEKTWQTSVEVYEAIEDASGFSDRRR